jgi:hypothetical protein
MSSHRRWSFAFALCVQALVATSCHGSKLVGPFPVAGITVINGDRQSGTIGTELPKLVTVRVTDQYGTPAKDVEIAFEVTTGGGTVAPQKVTSNDAGEASARWTLGPALGDQHLLARTAGLESVTFRAFAMSPLFIDAFTATPAVIAPGEASTLSWSARGAVAFTLKTTFDDTSRSPVSGDSLEVRPTKTTWYILTAFTPEGRETSAIAVVSVSSLAAVHGFQLTGSPLSHRRGHSATLLANGKVLVAGGYDADGAPLASAELYDPATGAWSSTGSLAYPRHGHRATLLPSGNVLVVGNGSGQPSSSTASSWWELYDPATGTWSSSGALAYWHAGLTMTLLTSGKVLVAGGGFYDEYRYPAYYRSSRAVSLWDEASGFDAGWSVMGAPRGFHTATLLGSGEVLVAGGDDNLSRYGAERYDPATQTWSDTGPLTNGRSHHTATLLPSGEVLACGGFYPVDAEYGGGYSIGTVERYVPASGTWSELPPVVTPRHDHTATLLPSGKVLLTGGTLGLIGKELVLSTAEVYDPGTGTSVMTAPLPLGLTGHTATMLPSGDVLVTGSGAALLWRDAT